MVERMRTKKPGEEKKDTKRQSQLIDALLYLKISGSFMAASTEVTVCLCVSVCVGERESESKKMCVQISLSTGWLQEIRCEQTITCSIWPGRGMRAVGGKHTFMYQVICQVDGAHGAPVSVPVIKYFFFHLAGAVVPVSGEREYLHIRG